MEYHQAFRSNGVRQDFDSVGHDKGRKSKAVVAVRCENLGHEVNLLIEGIEEKDERDDSMGSSL